MRPIEYNNYYDKLLGHARSLTDYMYSLSRRQLWRLNIQL